MANHENSTSSDALLATILRCANCSSSIAINGSKAKCSNCSHVFSMSGNGVWDFRKTSDDAPSIFEEAEFQRWLKVFREQESKNWVIYRNAAFRWIAQAGHRILGKQLRDNRHPSTLTLEIGAGTGALLDFVQSDRFVAVDTSIESLEVLKERWPNALCIAASADALPFGDAAFDAVVSLHTLEHLYFLAEALEESKRVLKRGGEFHYVIPTEGGLSFRLGRKFVTGPHLRKTYDMDVNYVMAREHINDAPRVLKFLRMYFDRVDARYWPFGFLRFLSPNAMIYGKCTHSSSASDVDYDAD